MKVYYLEDDLYPGTYNFKDDDDGAFPSGWVDLDGTDCETTVIASLDGHKKVLQLYDNHGVNYAETYLTFSSPQTSGTVEIWHRVTDNTKRTYIALENELNQYSVQLYFDNTNVYSYDGAASHDHGDFVADQWYHYKIVFDCATDTFDLYQDGILLDSGIDFNNVATTLTKITLRTHTDSAFYVYYDAIGFSWDTDYNIGDNTKVDWHVYNRELISNITKYPEITTRNNNYSYCIIELGDMESALFSIWNSRDFNKILITDGFGGDDYTTSENILFRGYLVDKTFSHNRLILTVASFGIILDWQPFTKDYILEEGYVRIVPGTAILTMYDDLDGNGAYTGGAEDFGWQVDGWHTNTDLGLMIVDNTNDVSSEIWYCSAITSTNETSEEAGDHNSLDVKKDVAGVYYIIESGSLWDTYITPVMNEGANIGEALKLNKIEIEYRIGFDVTSGGPKKEWYIEVDYDGTPKEVKRHQIAKTAGIMDWQEGTITLEGTDAVLQKYLTKTGVEYTDLTELKIYLSFHGGTEYSCTTNFKIDYLAVTVYYYNYEISTITQAITDNAASTITCAGIVWDETGVKVNDKFRIAQNSVQVVSDIANACGIPIDIIGLVSSEAGSSTLRPNGDGTQTEWTFDDSGGTGDHYKDVDEVVVDPNVGDGNIVKTHAEAWVQEEFAFETVVMGGANVATKIELHTYGQIDLNTVLCRASYYTTTTGWSATKSIVFPEGSYAWVTTTWDNISLSQADLDSLQIRYEGKELIPLGDYVSIDTSYIVVTYGVYSPYEKYISRYYKGMHCRQALESVCKLEGSFWMEDHINERFKLVRPANYELSDINLTQTEYGYDWEYEDKCNQIKRVDVFGNAANDIHCWAEDLTVSGYITKLIIDDSILTKADAQEVADTQLAIYNSKTPSIKMPLDGTYENLQLGYTVNITMVRPTVAAADYPIRMIKRTPIRDTIKTVIWAGLGETEAEESVGKAIKHAISQANKALSDRLIE